MTSITGWKFQFRAFVSLLVTVSFLEMVVSGIMMFMTPPGRIANWSGWKLLGLTKDQWTAIHLGFSALFLVSSLIHIWLNGRALLSYFRNRVTRALFLRSEWIVDIILCGLLLWGTLAEVAPFDQIIVLREKAKRIWDTASQQAPVPHAELLTLSQVAEAAGLDVGTLRSNLDARQIKANWEIEMFGVVAERYGLTPLELYNIAVGRSGQGRGFGGGGGRQVTDGETRAGFGRGAPGPDGSGGSGTGRGGAGGGFGRMILQDLCTAEKVELQTALDRLGKMGIIAKPEQTLRQIAESAGIRPSEVIEWIRPQ